MNDGHQAELHTTKAGETGGFTQHVGKEASISASLLVADRGEILEITVNAQHYIVLRFRWMARWSKGAWTEIDVYEYILHRSSLPSPDAEGRILVTNGDHAFKIFPHGNAIGRPTIKPRA